MFLLRKFTFWFSAMSIIIYLSDYFGSGLANIILSQFPPNTWLIRAEPFREWIIDESAFNGGSSILVTFRFTAYFIHYCFFLSIGFVLDYIIQADLRVRRYR